MLLIFFFFYLIGCCCYTNTNLDVRYIFVAPGRDKKGRRWIIYRPGKFKTLWPTLDGYRCFPHLYKFAVGLFNHKYIKNHLLPPKTAIILLKIEGKKHYLFCTTTNLLFSLILPVLEDGFHLQMSQLVEM